MDNIKITRKRGRPLGYKLSEESKNKIRLKRLGTHHTIETRNKISKSLRAYFRRRDSLSRSIKNEYLYISDEAVDWIVDNQSDIDSTENVMSIRRLDNLRQLELYFGSEIEDLFGHQMTPEFLVLVKELLHELDLDNKIDLNSIID